MFRTSSAAIAALFACAVTPALLSPALAQEPDGLKLPPGFHAQVVAEGLGTNLRHMAVRDNNIIFVSTRGSGAPAAGRGGRGAANSEEGGEGGGGRGRGAA